MKFKKRKKKSRLRGSRTAFGGSRQKRGGGDIGGHGFAGSGKRADHKKQKFLMLAKKSGAKSYFGKRGFTSRKTEKKKNRVLNLEEIKERFGSKGENIELKNYKILGKGDGFKGVIIARGASKSALEKMKGAGGEIIISKKERIENNEEKDKSEKKRDKK